MLRLCSLKLYSVVSSVRTPAALTRKLCFTNRGFENTSRLNCIGYVHMCTPQRALSTYPLHSLLNGIFSYCPPPTVATIAKEKYTKYGKSNKRHSKYVRLLLSAFLGFTVASCDYKTSSHKGMYIDCYVLYTRCKALDTCYIYIYMNKFINEII